ncbi:MAG TPA: hypothetical protein VER96_38790 [Polyangiaceae bacterium]|nr:hypothetical protein [Polyangiaceae bacterium]
MRHSNQRLLWVAFTVGLATVTNCSSSPSARRSSVQMGPGDAAGAAGAADAGAAGETQRAAAALCGVVGDNSECEPISGAPCNIAGGEICEYSGAHGGYMCFLKAQLAEPGGFCDYQQMVFCGPGMTCDNFTQKCTHYCCKDSDCSQGPCTPGIIKDGAAAMGICVDEYGAPGDDGEGGAGGAGGTGGASD